MEKQKNKQKGITLIALVVTIVVLIILAGVSINMLVGENGIINMAQKAKENTELAQVEEEKNLNTLHDILQTSGEIVILDKTVEEMRAEGTYVQGNTSIQDNKGNKVVIPNGFKIAEDSGINVSEGIVIEDNDRTEDGNGEEKGNQFVWIPVSNINHDGSNQITKTDGSQVEITLGRYTFLEDGTENLVQMGENYEEESIISSYYQELVESRNSNQSEESDGTNTTAKNLSEFIRSVKENGGYYIARYEASYRDGIKPYSKVSVTANEENSKIDGKLWNLVTQSEAAQAARNMYTNSFFESDLLNSYAWDTAISYIQKCSNNTDYSIQNSLNNTTISNTGKTGDEVCKINDMASNLSEWSTEYSMDSVDSTAYPCVDRGGTYYTEGDLAHYRGSSRYNANYAAFGFRVLIYI